MRAILMLVLALALLAAMLVAQNRPAKRLDIYVMDVEGGDSQLYVAPSGESVLIDTGNAGAAAVRDADRIMAAVWDAGLKQIDHLITTHYHGDHIGGLLELAKRIPIQEFIDHGPNVQPAPAIDPILEQYAVLNAKVKHRVVKPGDKVDVTGLDWRVVTSPGRGLSSPLPGAGSANPHCAGFKTHNAYTFSRPPVCHTQDEQTVSSATSFS